MKAVTYSKHKCAIIFEDKFISANLSKVDIDDINTALIVPISKMRFFKIIKITKSKPFEALSDLYDHLCSNTIVNLGELNKEQIIKTINEISNRVSK